MVLPAVIGAGASIAGGLISSLIGSKSSAKDRQLAYDIHLSDQNWQRVRYNMDDQWRQRYFNQDNTRYGREWIRDQTRFNIERADRERYARNAAGWQFQDLMQAADASGIHRLAALGAGGGSSYSPVGGTGSSYNAGGTPAFSGGGGGSSVGAGGGMSGDAIGSGIAEAGGILQAALEELSDEKQQERAMQERAQKAAVRRVESEAQLNEAQSRTIIKNTRERSRDQQIAAAIAREPTLEEQVRARNEVPDYLGGNKVEYDPGTSDASRMTERGGEGFDWVASFNHLTHHMQKTTDKKARAQLGFSPQKLFSGGYHKDFADYAWKKFKAKPNAVKSAIKDAKKKGKRFSPKRGWY